MLGQEKQTKSSRWVRLSLAATILVVVVVCAVSFSSNAPDSLEQKSMVAGVDREPYDGDYDMTGTVPKTDDEEFEDADPAVENVDDEDEDDVEEDGEMVAENGRRPKKRFCVRLCRMRFRGKRRRLCIRACNKDSGDFSKPIKCFKDCQASCAQLVSRRKRQNCVSYCKKTFCFRPIRLCKKMCAALGKTKQMKRPVRKNVKKCKNDCRKSRGMRKHPRACKRKCMRACVKFAKKPALCNGGCGKVCQKI